MTKMLKGFYIKSEIVEIKFQYVFNSSKTFSCISFEYVLVPSNINSDPMEKKEKSKANTLYHRFYFYFFLATMMIKVSWGKCWLYSYASS